MDEKRLKGVPSMVKKKKQYVRFGLAVVIITLFWTVGTGYYRDLAAKSEESYKGLKIFSEVIELVEKNYVDPVDSKELINKAIQGMVRSLDPHSSFLPPEAFKELKIDTQGKFGGIGIVITMQKGVLTVISPIEGTPAHKAGIKAGDKIIKVNGESTKNMMLWEAVKKMRGPKRTSVVITVLREGLKEPVDFKLIRDIIPIESVKSFPLKPRYGYIRITNFNDNTSTELKSNLEKLESGALPLKGLIIDLRDNPGGLLNQSIKVSDMFLEKGTIVSIKGRQSAHTKTFKAHANEVKQEYPMVVLINGGSASASEIVAGALQDHKKALILGTASFGKGSVQTVESLRDGYGLKYTIARYYTPSGRSIQAQGIVPDIEVKKRLLGESAIVESEEGLLKEKDLENHLGVEPDDHNKKKSDSSGNGDRKEKIKIPRPDSRYGPLKIEMLKSDNQVIRALEVLISYNIFKDGK